MCGLEDGFTCVLRLRDAVSVLLGGAEGGVPVTSALDTKPDMSNTTPIGRLRSLAACEMGRGNKQRCR